MINRHAPSIAAFAAGRRLPAISGGSAFALAGNLSRHGPTCRDFFRHAATFVDRIPLREKPADLPVEQPRRFEFVVNRKAAQAIGLALAQSLALRADEVIE